MQMAELPQLATRGQPRATLEAVWRPSPLTAGGAGSTRLPVTFGQLNPCTGTADFSFVNLN